MDYTARVTPHRFAAIHCFAATQDVRSYLNGVTIEPHPDKGVVIMATNGFHMGVIHDPDGWAARHIIVGDLSRQLIDACKGKLPERGKRPKADKPHGKKAKKHDALPHIPQRLFIGQDGALLDWGRADSEPPASPFDAQVLFADRISLIKAEPIGWRKVLSVERQPNGPMPLVNLALLTPICEAARVLNYNRDHSAACHLEVANDGKIIARLPHSLESDRFVAAVMPMRDDQPRGDLIPAALAPKPKQKPRLQFSSSGALLDTIDAPAEA
jgi:DNA polymerase-3 subunit beta